MGGVSLQPKQFRQQTLWPAAAETTHVEGGAYPIEMGGPPEDRRVDYRGGVEFNVRRTLPNGGTSSSWQSPYLRSAYADNVRRSATNPVREAELDSGQRAMFMTPREIHKRWEPLYGDRHDAYGMTDAGTETRALQPHVTHQTAGGSRYQSDYVETDEELWGRKLDESMMPKRDYGMDVHGMGSANTDDFINQLDLTTNYPAYESGHTATFDERAESWAERKAEQWRAEQDDSLYDSIAREGVRSPVRLGESHKHWGGQTPKPQIVGGHHRLAAATDIDEDALIPVLHHEDIAEARSGRTQMGYRYS